MSKYFFYQVFIYKVKVNERLCLLLPRRLETGCIWHVHCYCHPTLGYLNCHKVESAPLRSPNKVGFLKYCFFLFFFCWVFLSEHEQWLRHEEEGTATGAWPGHRDTSTKANGGNEWECLQLNLESHISHLAPDNELPWRARQSICFWRKQ